MTAHIGACKGQEVDKGYLPESNGRSAPLVPSVFLGGHESETTFNSSMTESGKHRSVRLRSGAAVLAPMSLAD